MPGEVSTRVTEPRLTPLPRRQACDISESADGDLAGHGEQAPGSERLGGGGWMSVVPEARLWSVVPQARLRSVVPEARLMSVLPQARR